MSRFFFVRDKRKLLDRLFPERQIFHRSDGSVRFLTLSPRVQMLGVGIGTILLGWMLYATADFFINLPNRGKISADILRENDSYRNGLRHARAKEAAAMSLLEEKTVSFDQASSDFERRHAVLSSLLEQVRNEAGLDTQPDRKGRESVLIKATLDEADRRRDRPSVPSGEKPGDGAQNGVQNGPQEKLQQVAREQLHFLDITESVLVDRIEHFRGVLDATGVSVRELIQRASNIGGPYVELPDTGQREGDDQFFARARQVAARLEESMLIEELINSVPLGGPVGSEYRLTSPFGRRLDPFSGQMAWHSGVDIAAWPNSPIIAVAPGKVTYAGHKSGYGNVVEIDHGFGFKSRYGHLRSFEVESGEYVNSGHNLGAMGSTGRSTGIHLHYEVLFGGKVYNPMRFIEAGEYMRR